MSLKSVVHGISNDLYSYINYDFIFYYVIHFINLLLSKTIETSFDRGNLFDIHNNNNKFIHNLDSLHNNFLISNRRNVRRLKERFAEE